MALTVEIPEDTSGLYQPLGPLANARQVFEDMCRRNPKARIELSEEGEILNMAPVGLESAYQKAEVLRQLANWVAVTENGYAFGPTAGFDLPSGANRSPDAAWVSKERLFGSPGKSGKGSFRGAPILQSK